MIMVGDDEIQCHGDGDDDGRGNDGNGHGHVNMQCVNNMLQREAYFRGQERSARAFMALASAVLDILANMAVDIPTAFISTTMIADKTASMLNHFFDMLCGPSSVNLKVENPEKYGFQPKVLLMKIAQVWWAVHC